MKNRLYIIEGLPCSGKSTVSAYVASLLEKVGPCRFVDEGTGNHPADYECHALAPAGMLGEKAQIVRLDDYSGATLEALLPYKVYDGLPWETERPLMLEKWRQFVRESDADTAYVFNCVLLQNPMCETMMRFDFDESVSAQYIREICGIIAPMRPVVIYLHNDDIAASVMRTAGERPGWLEAVIDYHINGGYGRRVGASGFDGYIDCLAERQRRERHILSELPVDKVILENPQRDRHAAMQTLAAQMEAL